MRKGTKLVVFEFNRSSRIYFILLALMLISQLLGFFIMSKGYMTNVNHYVQTYGFNVPSIIETVGLFSVDHVIQSIWVMGPLSVCIVFVAAYAFIIWYRDWYGSTTFIYRLLMLPVKRIYLFLGKAITLLVMILGVVAFQLFLLYIGKMIIQWNVPIDLRPSLSVSEMIFGFNYLTIFFPFTITTFFTLITVLFVLITILFTAILFERSFAKKGIVYGIGFIVGALCVLFMPEFIEMILKRSYAYPLEMFWLQGVLFILVGYVSMRTSSYLLNEKVHV